MDRPVIHAVLLVAFLGWGPLGLAADDTSDRELYQAWAEYMERVMPEWDAHTKFWDESLGWQAAPALRGLVNGYRYSHEERWLRHLTKQVDELMARLKVTEGHPGWGHSITGEALLLEPIFEFIELSQTDPKMPAEYRRKAEGYLKVVEPAMITKWDAMGRWRETHMDCGTYVEGITLPHNKNAHVGMMLLRAARVTPSAERRAEYLDKATRLARRWRKFLKVEGDHYIWHYWDAAGRWDYDEKGKSRHWTSLEHRGYAIPDTRFVAEAYDHGIVFDRRDVEMHCRTFLNEIWNGDDESPAYRPLGWFNPKYDKSGVFMGLARFDAQIMDLLGKRTREAVGGWHGMCLVPYYLLAKERGVGFERRHADFVREVLRAQAAEKPTRPAGDAAPDEPVVR